MLLQMNNNPNLTEARVALDCLPAFPSMSLHAAHTTHTLPPTPADFATRLTDADARRMSHMHRALIPNTRDNAI